MRETESGWKKKLCIRNMMRAFLPAALRCIVDVYTDSSTLILCRSWFFFSLFRHPLRSVWHRLLFYSAMLLFPILILCLTRLFFQLIFHFIISHCHLVAALDGVRGGLFFFLMHLWSFYVRKYGLILSFFFSIHSYLCNFNAPNSVYVIAVLLTFFVPLHFGFRPFFLA